MIEAPDRRQGMRLGVYSDLTYRERDGVVSTNRAFIRFVTALPPRVDEVVIAGRLDPEPGTGPYALPAAGVRFVPLPHYPRVTNVIRLLGVGAAVVPAVRADARRGRRRLDLRAPPARRGVRDDRPPARRAARARRPAGLRAPTFATAFRVGGGAGRFPPRGRWTGCSAASPGGRRPSRWDARSPGRTGAAPPSSRPGSRWSPSATSSRSTRPSRGSGPRRLASCRSGGSIRRRTRCSSWRSWPRHGHRARSGDWPSPATARHGRSWSGPPASWDWPTSSSSSARSRTARSCGASTGVATSSCTYRSRRGCRRCSSRRRRRGCRSSRRRSVGLRRRSMAGGPGCSSRRRTPHRPSRPSSCSGPT